MNLLYISVTDGQLNHFHRLFEVDRWHNPMATYSLKFNLIEIGKSTQTRSITNTFRFSSILNISLGRMYICKTSKKRKH